MREARALVSKLAGLSEAKIVFDWVQKQDGVAAFLCPSHSENDYSARKQHIGRESLFCFLS